MTCEKQFVGENERQLYCSDACQKGDESTATSSRDTADFIGSFRSSSYMSQLNEPTRDIIPRASPSRPTSNYFSASPPVSPATADYHHSHSHSHSQSQSHSHSHHQNQHSAAISSLRSLSIRPPSPQSPGGESFGGFWPFGSRSSIASPSTSLNRIPATGYFSSTYDPTSSTAAAAAASPYSYYNAPASVTGADRPLPPRRGYRPKSIELVTPMLSQ